MGRPCYVQGLVWKVVEEMNNALLATFSIMENQENTGLKRGSKTGGQKEAEISLKSDYKFPQEEQDEKFALGCTFVSTFFGAQLLRSSHLRSPTLVQFIKKLPFTL